MHHFFVAPEAVHGNFITITGSDVNHMKNVLRMKPGEELLISDGTGRDYLCRICHVKEDCMEAEILDGTYQGTELPAKLYLFQGLPKADKMEWIIQKAVELGVYEIIPVITKRTVVRLDAKKEEAKGKRWNAISESAAKQSRRSIVPKVKSPMSFPEAVKYAEELDFRFIPYENYKDMEETRKILSQIEGKQSIGIFIGPEGGFEEAEVDLAVSGGCERISLGKRILRTETAGLAILSVLMFRIEEGNE